MKKFLCILVIFGLFLLTSCNQDLSLKKGEVIDGTKDNITGLVKDGIQIKDEGEYSIYLFEDNRQCEVKAYDNGECIDGGYKITGFDNELEIFCKITGGDVIAGVDKCTKNEKEYTLKNYYDLYLGFGVKNSQNLPSCDEVTDPMVQCELTDLLVPKALVKQNMKNTDTSLDITLQDCNISDEEGFYITYTCNAKVNQIFIKNNNDLNIGEYIKYRHTLEKNEGFDINNYNGKRKLVSVSLINYENEQYYIEPDVAYGFEYDKKLEKYFIN